MKANNNKISTLLSFIIAMVNSLALYMAKQSWLMVIIMAIIFFTVYYVLLRVLLYFMVFKHLGQVWSNIRSLRKGKSPHNTIDHSFSTKWIDTEVNLLMHEKAIEIRKLKKIERFRKDFLGNVAHELRTPLFGIQGYLHTLLDGAAENPELREKFLGKATKNADSLAAIIEDLITISRIETNELKVEPSNFNLVELIDEVIESLDFQAEQKEITIKRKGLQNVAVYADFQKIKQVFTNLLSNSIQYGNHKGTTTISLYDLKEYVLVEVSDNGIGIDKGDLAHIFERFYRIDKNRSRDQDANTGLGLSIVKHFLEAHGQKIKARSSLGKGTIFTFTLPKYLENASRLGSKTT